MNQEFLFGETVLQVIIFQWRNVQRTALATRE